MSHYRLYELIHIITKCLFDVVAGSVIASKVLVRKDIYGTINARLLRDNPI